MCRFAREDTKVSHLISYYPSFRLCVPACRADEEEDPRANASDLLAFDLYRCLADPLKEDTHNTIYSCPPAGRAGSLDPSDGDAAGGWETSSVGGAASLFPLSEVCVGRWSVEYQPLPLKWMPNGG